MESAINGNWIGAVVSLPAAAVVVFMVLKFLVFIREERKASNETIIQIVDRTEKVAQAHTAGLKENTDRLGAMSVTMATTLSDSTNNCKQAQRRMDQASDELRRSKEDVVGG